MSDDREYEYAVRVSFSLSSAINNLPFQRDYSYILGHWHDDMSDMERRVDRLRTEIGSGTYYRVVRRLKAGPEEDV